jgi:hypothetical protein
VSRARRAPETAPDAPIYRGRPLALREQIERGMAAEVARLPGDRLRVLFRATGETWI